jgi:predicted nucleotidyltransferase
MCVVSAVNAEVYDALLSRLTQACREVYGDSLVSLVVFGSVARDTPRADSDIYAP